MSPNQSLSQRHKQQAQHNENFASDVASFLPPKGQANQDYDYLDWAITGLFYSALHWVRAFLASKGYGFDDYGSHKDAFRLLKKHLKDLVSQNQLIEEKVGSVLIYYVSLKDNSEEVRYNLPDPDKIRQLYKDSCDHYSRLKDFFSKLV